MSGETIITEIKNEVSKVEGTIRADIPKVESAIVRFQIWIKNNPVKSALIFGLVVGFILGTLV